MNTSHGLLQSFCSSEALRQEIVSRFTRALRRSKKELRFKVEALQVQHQVSLTLRRLPSMRLQVIVLSWSSTKYLQAHPLLTALSSSILCDDGSLIGTQLELPLGDVQRNPRRAI